jgi:hypothetical protein
MPVRDVQHRGEAVGPDLRELVRLGEDRGEHNDADEQAAERRQQAARPAAPEAPELDPPLLAPLREQQRRDQEPREHEEEVDAEIPADQQVGVEEQHAGHGGAPQAVEGGHVPQPRRSVAVLATVDDGLGGGCSRRSREQQSGAHRLEYPITRSSIR